MSSDEEIDQVTGRKRKRKDDEYDSEKEMEDMLELHYDKINMEDGMLVAYFHQRKRAERIYGKNPPGPVRISRQDMDPALAFVMNTRIYARKGVEGGFRSVRASHGTSKGSFFFEATLLAPSSALGDETESNLPPPHWRVGWGSVLADIHTPVGSDQYGYGYRDVDGTALHEGRRLPYGQGFGAGDVIGCLLELGEHPPSPKTIVDRQQYFDRGSAYIVQEEREQSTPCPDSRIVFYVNGQRQGEAFTNIASGCYYPMASLYMGAGIVFSLGPRFQYPPSGSWQPVSDLEM
eukprot:gb/GECH01003740.1/.p1 GENE.gb/GECH01003740.1/~~gb/GECH01003740.1/.p1  ORF type:complete len:291 (+),score=37.95 gb/GECH01003740.1/:1-873(+)